MNMFRKVVFWSHLVVGLAVTINVALLALTGLLMAFEHPIVAWAESAEEGNRLETGPRSHSI